MVTPARFVALAAGLVLMGSACRGPGADLKPARIAVAERYFRGVYGSDPSVVDDLAGEAIVVSYPIFERLFGTPTIQGRDAIKGFVERFGQTWTDSHVEFSDAVSDGDTVVLRWSFRARNVGPLGPGQPATNQEHHWGGMTLFRFDEVGKVVAEIGYEGEPRPVQ